MKCVLLYTMIAITIFLIGCDGINEEESFQPDDQISEEKIKQEDKDFLNDYDWTITEAINSISVTLPENFLHEPGEFPKVIYWAYNNELNKDIGKDLEPYLGNEVTVNLYDIEEDLPEFMSPREDSGRAIIVRYEDDIIGAWLGAGRHDDFACSLKGNSFEEVVGKTWDEWVYTIIDANHPKEEELAGLGAEEVVKEYWQAADMGDYDKAYSLLSRCNIKDYLFMNMDNKEIYNHNFQQAVIGGLYNIESVEMLEIEEIDHLNPGKTNEIKSSLE
ncbi:DUF4830 domain-containing protein [Natranaerobius thermophilus]|uniref:DUF4830 domain-containing protein n=1 Tax=Natranaerobius thermophilus TaxID=375929 RepID=UPI000166A970|nr:DUF4830 domain-containing protein [Natranaerobius thermophilus]